MAVGRYLDSAGHVEGLLLTLSGGSWTAAEAPLPANADGSWAYLTGVSCPSSSDCVATGNYSDSSASDTSGVGDGLLLTLSGGSWTAAEAPLPANANHTGVYLDAVSCASSSTCVAVGEYDITYTEGANSQGEYQNGMLLTLTNGSWTAAPAPPVPNSRQYSSVNVTAVSCPSASYCVATGSYSDGTTYDSDGLLLTLSGGSWTAAEAPVPSDDTNIPNLSVETFGVSCPSTSECMATEGGGNGSATSASQDDTYWALLTSAGQTWNPDEAPTTTTPFVTLSCPSATECVSVGATGGEQLQLVTWSAGSGPSWTTATLPPPANADASRGFEVNGISCPSAAACVAVGSYTDTSGNQDGLLLTESG